MHKNLKIFIGIVVSEVVAFLCMDAYFSSQQIMLREPYQKIIMGLVFVPLIICLFFVATHYLKHSRLSKAVRNILKFNVGFIALGLIAGYIFYSFTTYEHEIERDGAVYITTYSRVYDNTQDTHVYYSIQDKYFIKRPYAFIEFPEND